MNGGPQAILFDFYGTLVHLRRQRVALRLPRVLGIGGRRWIQLVRNVLLVEPLMTKEAFLERIFGELGLDPAPEVRQEAVDLVEEELASAEPVSGVRSLLSFLKRRGYRLGLLSNLTGLHASVLDRLQLTEAFDALCLSCVEGIAKPDPRIYARLCERLGVPPETALIVGDSLPNDVVAPRRIGMRALRVTGSFGPGSVPAVTALGWLDLRALPELRTLVPGEIRLGSSELILGPPQPLSDEEQGRYNLVARAPVLRDDGPTEQVYFKRFLLPAAAYVEEFANQLLAWLELPGCEATIVSSGEPCLISSAARGEKLNGAGGPDLAYEVGRHGAVSYIFANGDLRPRNAFVEYRDGRAVMTLVDLEHFFFNLAIDVEGLEEPQRPQTIDGLTPEELDKRLRRRVLSERTTRRAMRSFLEIPSLDSPAGRAFKDGWMSVYSVVRKRALPLVALIRDRVYREPFLIIGTHSYRRAMASIDIEDIAGRIHLDAEAILPRLVAYSKSS